ncbi:sterile alpha motif domain-containing protein 1 [Phyllostomus hastatus]|uniref:sterile alpha motif domain-containing protein 1 n=1 Tax=Phyllostomus hastatus TaxID=9423 RepID=UPI001E681065|nr:sterile alpha motif domain-containing protein 1 [Phyllostomus hastatus]
MYPEGHPPRPCRPRLFSRSHKWKRQFCKPVDLGFGAQRLSSGAFPGVCSAPALARRPRCGGAAPPPTRHASHLPRGPASSPPRVPGPGSRVPAEVRSPVAPRAPRERAAGSAAAARGGGVRRARGAGRGLPPPPAAARPPRAASAPPG